jgi:hypothetical protein
MATSITDSMVRGTDPPPSGEAEGVAAKFWARIDTSDPNGCWPWKGPFNSGGYGHFQEGRRGPMTRAHRRAYQLAKGPIPDGLLVCHTCDNPPCCNPAHLWLGTSADNKKDAISKGRAVNPPTLRGEKNGASRITDKQRAELISDRLSGMTYREIGDRHCLSADYAKAAIKTVGRKR